MEPARKWDWDFEAIDSTDIRYEGQLKDKVRTMKHQRAQKIQKKMAFRSRTFEVFAVAMALVFFVVLNINQWSMLCQMSDHINQTNREISALSEEIERLEVAIDTSMNLKRVEKVALEELQMIYPHKEQIVYIDDLWHYTLLPEEREVVGAQN